MAVEKEAALKRMAEERAAAHAQMRAAGIEVWGDPRPPYGLPGAPPAPPSTSGAGSSAVPAQVARPGESAGTPAVPMQGVPAPPAPGTPARVVPNTPVAPSIPATPTKQAEAAPVAVAPPPPPRKESLPPEVRRGSGSLGPGERKESTGMGGKRGML